MKPRSVQANGASGVLVINRPAGEIASDVPGLIGHARKSKRPAAWGTAISARVGIVAF